MDLTREQLKNVVVEVAREQFGSATFLRRELMIAVEQRVRSAGHWTAADDQPARAAAPESRGLALIDWGITALKDEGRLLNPERDAWRLPSSQELLGSAKQPAAALGKPTCADLIVRDQRICGGEPVIRGTRVTLRTILASLADGDDIPDILYDFPSLTEQDVRAVLVFAASAAFDDLPSPGVPV